MRSSVLPGIPPSASPGVCLLVLLLGTAVAACTTWESQTPWSDDDASAADDDDTGDDDTGDDDTGDDDTGDDDTGDDDTGDDDTGSNLPPTAPLVTIDPPDPEPEDDLVCSIVVDSTDPEHDPVSYSWAWAVDGGVTGIAGPTVPAVATSDGQFWSCNVTPNDGTQDGPPGMASVVLGDVVPFGYSPLVTFDADGGPSGGPATVYYDHVMLDENFDPQCTISFEFGATYTYGVGQGNDFFQYVDETITWTSGGELGSSCPITWTVYTSNPVSEWIWDEHPFAFVSCDQVGAVGDLASTFVGEDDAGYLPTTDGSFADFCDNVGPSVESSMGTGPVEAIWFMSGSDGMLDSLGTWSYFAPPDTSNVQVYVVSGMLMQQTTNTDEPVPGLQGGYAMIPFWIFVYNY